MKTLGDGMKELLALLGGGEDEASRKAQRAASVNHRWKTAVEAVYKDAASLVLDHVNAVYIMKADDVDDARAADQVTNGGTVLVVYSDDSLIRSDIDARQEFLKMKLNEQGEHVEAFCIKPSRFDMKARHPFRSGEGGAAPEADPLAPARRAPVRLLTQEERAKVEGQVAGIENRRVREALAKAMAADMQRKSPEDNKNSE